MDLKGGVTEPAAPTMQKYFLQPKKGRSSACAFNHTLLHYSSDFVGSSVRESSA